MPYVEPVHEAALEEFAPLFALVEQMMGFVPNSMKTMAHRPDILRGFAGLAGAVLGPGTVPAELKHLVSFVASRAAGCRYCQAHTSHSAQRAGAPPGKLDAAFEFETSPLFDAAERAALRLAAHAAVVPNAVEAEDFAAAREHFSEEQIVELMAVVSLFGFLNRWNDSLATELEATPRAFAARQLAERGWEPGRHVKGEKG